MIVARFFFACVAAVITASGTLAAKDSPSDYCEAFRKAAAVNRDKLPLQIDQDTVGTDVIVECDARSITFVKKVNRSVLVSDDEWIIQNQTRHRELHCAETTIASHYGWTVTDLFYDENNEVLAELRTRPQECTGVPQS